jgi:hypothetical protein
MELKVNKSRFLTFFLILTIWLSTTGFTPLHASTVQTTAYAPVPVEAMAPDPFGKSEPANNASVLTSQVTLTWQASTGAVSYQYCIFTKTSCPPGQWKSAGSSTSVTVILKPSNIYYWQIRAVASDATLTYADNGVAWKFTTGTAAPSTFNKSAPANNATDQPINPTLSWQPSTGLNVNYQVCVDTVDNKPTPLCDTTWVQVGSGTTYTLSGLDYNKDYYWQVRAYNSKGVVYGNGSLATFWHFKTKIAPPTPFMKLTPENEAANLPLSLALTWSPSTGTNVTYQYCLVTINPGTNNCVDSGGTWSTFTPNTYAELTGLTYNQTYYWQVRALNNSNPADTVLANGGAWWKFNTLVADPQIFTKLFPDDQAADVSITPYLYWTVAAGTNVSYEYCVKAGAASTCDTSPTSTDWTPVGGAFTYVKVPALLRDTTYVWQIRAQAAGVSGYTYADGETVLRQFKTIPEAPVAEPLTQSFSTQEDTQKIGQLTSTHPSNKTYFFTLSGHEPASQNFILSSTGQFTFMPQQDFNGTVTFDYTIWDGVNLPTGPYTATINVIGVNDTPVIDPVVDVTVFTGGDVFFTVQTSDADLQYDDTITITRTGALPTGAAFTTSTDPTTHAASADFEWFGATWTPTHPGPYTFTVRATDSGGAFTEDTFTISVTAYKIILPVVMK